MTSNHPLMNIEPGMKIAAQASPEPTQEDLQYIQQLGLEYVVLWTDGKHSSYEYYASRRALFEEAGIKVDIKKRPPAKISYLD